MEFNESPLFNDVNSVIHSTAPRPYYYYRATIRTGAGEAIDAIKVISIDSIEDYRGEYAAQEQIELMFGLGTYLNQIFKNRDSLEIVLHTTRYEGAATEEFYQTYRAILSSNAPSTTSVTELETNEEFTLDVKEVVTIGFQITNKAVDQIETLQAGGVFHEVTTADLVRTVLSQAIAQVESEEDELILGIDIQGEVNDSVYPQIMIPHARRVVDIPGYVQEHCGGIFPTGLSHFVKGRHWYIFPTYDTERYTQSPRCLEIVLVPQNRFELLDKTYLNMGSVTLVLSAGDRENDRSNEAEQQSKGDGVRFTSADAVTNSLTQDIGDGKVVLSRGDTVNEFVVDNPKSGYNLANPSPAVITNNQYRELSRLASLQGTYFTCVWNHSDPDAVVPGTMGRIKFIQGDEVRVVEGVLVGSQTTAQLYGQGITSTSHVHATALTFFIERDFDFDSEI